MADEENFSKFLNPEMIKSIPFFQKQSRKDHAITILLDIVTHRPGEAKWSRGI